VTSSPDFVSVTVVATNPLPTSNIAPLATVTASSETPATGQLAIKAVDGVIDGYPGDYTREWATNQEGVGAWLDLSWPATYTVNRVVLYDRPNSGDQILGGTILFSDGTTLTVGPLDNDGMATEYQFGTKSIVSLRLTVNAVSPGSANIGLAEIEVYGLLANDIDGDGVPNADDCAPEARGTSAIPGETNGLRSDADKRTLHWNAATQAHVDDLYRGSVAHGVAFTYNHQCVAASVTLRSAVDPMVPAPGEFFYYLVEGRNSCGDGSLGSGNEGQRPQLSACASDPSADSDGDGTPDVDDVCAAVSDPAQIDTDGDGLGDACDAG